MECTKHLYNFRLDVGQMERVEKLEENKTQAVTNALDLYLRVKQEGFSLEEFLNKDLSKDGCKDDVKTQDEEALWNDAYTTFYNQELLPLSVENKHLKSAVAMLRNDKDYLKSRINYFENQVSALILAKHSILARIKMRLLNRKSDF